MIIHLEQLAQDTSFWESTPVRDAPREMTRQDLGLRDDYSHEWCDFGLDQYELWAEHLEPRLRLLLLAP
jgi:hypothetical protein